MNHIRIWLAIQKLETALRAARRRRQDAQLAAQIPVLPW